VHVVLNRVLVTAGFGAMCPYLV